MKAVVTNLGLVMQIAGVFLILPAAAAALLGEMDALPSFLLTGFSFFVWGFILNAFAERTELNYRHSCILLTSAFLFLSLIGSMPYLWLNPFGQVDWLSRFSNSVFESTSGFTTTGLSMITDLDAMPRSLALYRSLTEFIGGIGIVFLLLGFFYRGKTLGNISRIIGIVDVTKNLKRSFVSVLFLYVLYTAIITGLLFLFGYGPAVNALSIVISGLMTGGLSPLNDFASFTTVPGIYFLIAAMLLGSISFTIHYRFFLGKFRDVFKRELLVYLALLAVGTLVVWRTSGFGLLETVFHVVSASSGTGFSTWNFAEISQGLKGVFIALMFIGGMSFSTSGGIKILRFALLLKAIPATVRSLLTDKSPETLFDDRHFSARDLAVNGTLILLSIASVFLGALALTTAGHSFTDSLFEAVSAFGTVGMSVGIAVPALAVELKWVFILLMLVGRIEVIPFLVAFVRHRDSSLPGRLPVPTPQYQFRRGVQE
ncbi:MAG: TrkH family potassium uptake protein [Candidatus Aenigmarchaeota archaeon]|nr:TrkH family potassium uptake protein [Candidatus Aenigmarchaeota archaeon]